MCVAAGSKDLEDRWVRGARSAVIRPVIILAVTNFVRLCAVRLLLVAVL